MNTLGSNPRVLCPLRDDYGIAIGYPCDTKVPEGTLVKMKSDGTVTPVTAATDVPFGVVSVGNNLPTNVVGDKVTVQVPFIAVLVAEADGTVDEGNLLASTGRNTAGTLMKYKVGVATNYISAVCLRGGLTTTEVLVGILPTPIVVKA